ncbi:hypothetical protein ACU4GI_24395 [Cupriavidus basilensis]
MKTQENPSARPCGHILHTYPDLYILISYQPKGSESNYVRASCEAVEEGNPQAGNGLSIYLSPFDAYLAAAYVSKPGNPFHAIPAADFDPRELIRDSGENSTRLCIVDGAPTMAVWSSDATAALPVSAVSQRLTCLPVAWMPLI